MTKELFEKRKKVIEDTYAALYNRVNQPVEELHGLYTRYKYPILTNEHLPLNWKFDFNYETNPALLQRIGVNAVLNAGAIYLNQKYIVIARVEGWDRKSYFAVAESDNGIDHWTFRKTPVVLPDTVAEETNVYDMRLTQHEDGWIYGLFCSERKDPDAKPGDLSSAVAVTGIVRTKDLDTWERMPDLVSKSQQRNVVLHPEFVQGRYALYTRPQDGFIDAGSGGGIGWAFIYDMSCAVVNNEKIIDSRLYHTIKEVKNGQGPAPIKTEKGWLNLAHGVRGCAAGLRYVLYMFMTDLHEPWKVIAQPGGFFMAPEGDERIGDVSNVLFTNGWIRNENDEVFIYYASSDTRLHVATTTVDTLIDYCMNTPQDGLRSAASVRNICNLIASNDSVKATVSEECSVA